MRFILAIPAAVLLAGAAQGAPVPRHSDAKIAAGLKAGETVEARIDGDFNGDGEVDTAWIVAGPDARRVHAVFAVRGKSGHVPAGRFDLPPDPLGPATLSVNKDVLVIEDLTGGTTALSATYRFRGDKAAPHMRLIGLDATLYSRSYAHDGSKMSWNLLTGDLITAGLKLSGSGEDVRYDTVGTKRVRRPISILWMENTPDAEAELAAARP